LVIRRPERPDEKGEVRRSGRSRRPARVGDAELMAW